MLAAKMQIRPIQKTTMVDVRLWLGAMARLPSHGWKSAELDPGLRQGKCLLKSTP